MKAEQKHSRATAGSLDAQPCRSTTPRYRDTSGAAGRGPCRHGVPGGTDDDNTPPVGEASACGLEASRRSDTALAGEPAVSGGQEHRVVAFGPVRVGPREPAQPAVGPVAPADVASDQQRAAGPGVPLRE